MLQQACRGAAWSSAVRRGAAAFCSHARCAGGPRTRQVCAEGGRVHKVADEALQLGARAVGQGRAHDNVVRSAVAPQKYLQCQAPLRDPAQQDGRAPFPASMTPCWTACQRHHCQEATDHDPSRRLIYGQRDQGQGVHQPMSLSSHSPGATHFAASCCRSIDVSDSAYQPSLPIEGMPTCQAASMSMNIVAPAAEARSRRRWLTSAGTRSGA